MRQPHERRRSNWTLQLLVGALILAVLPLPGVSATLAEPAIHDRSQGREKAEDAAILESDDPGTSISPGIPFDAHASLEVERDPRERAETASGIVNEFISATWPDEHAGAWMKRDVDDHTVYYGVTAAIDRDDVRKRVEAEVPADIDLVPVRTAHSFSELDKAALELTQQFRNGSSIRSLGHDVDPHDFAIGVRPSENAISVVGPSVDPHAETATQGSLGQSAVRSDTDGPVNRELRFASALSSMADGVPVLYTPSGPMRPDCERHDCRYTMRAGLRVDGPRSCSTGYSARGGSGRHFFLTAGHCGDGTFRNGGSTYGRTDRNRIHEDLDVQRVVRTNSQWSLHSWYIFLGPQSFRRIDNTIANSQISLGTQVGRTGYSTGTRRGWIRDLSVRLPGLDNSPKSYVAADYCSDRGDSGGGVFRNNTAYGLHISSSRVIPGGEVDSCVHSAFYSVFLPIRRAASSLNVTIVHP